MNRSFMKQELNLGGEGAGRRALLGLCFLVGFTILLFRFFDLQVLQAEMMTQKARRQHEKTITLDSNRGAIFDRQGKPLALNLDVPSVYATPSSIDSPTLVARQLAQVLDIPREPLEKRLRAKREFV